MVPQKKVPHAAQRVARTADLVCPDPVYQYVPVYQPNVPPVLVYCLIVYVSTEFPYCLVYGPKILNQAFRMSTHSQYCVIHVFI